MMSEYDESIRTRILRIDFEGGEDQPATVALKVRETHFFEFLFPKTAALRNCLTVGHIVLSMSEEPILEEI